MRSQSAVGLDIAVDQVCIRISRMQLVDVHKLGCGCRVGAGGQSATWEVVAKALWPT